MTVQPACVIRYADLPLSTTELSWMSQQVLACLFQNLLFLSPLICPLFLAAAPCWKRSWLIIQGSTEAEIMMNFIIRVRKRESERKRERGAEGNVLSCWNGVWLVKGFWVRLWQINCHLLPSHFPGMSEPIMALLSRGEIKRPITASDLLSLLSNIPTQGGELRLW